MRQKRRCKSNELIFAKATSNSGGHSKTRVTGRTAAVLSWHYSSVQLKTLTGQNQGGRGEKMCVCVDREVEDSKTGRRCDFCVNARLVGVYLSSDARAVRDSELS